MLTGSEWQAGFCGGATAVSWA